MGTRLTERGRWVLIYLPTFVLAETGVIMGALALCGPQVFQP